MAKVVSKNVRPVRKVVAKGKEGKDVNSSNLKSVTYNNESKTLTIVFHRGNRTYEYFKVPRPVYTRMLSASSQGEFHHKFIKYRYKYKEISTKVK